MEKALLPPAFGSRVRRPEARRRGELLRTLEADFKEKLLLT
jgi:hypothetical protein